MPSRSASPAVSAARAGRSSWNRPRPRPNISRTQPLRVPLGCACPSPMAYLGRQSGVDVCISVRNVRPTTANGPNRTNRGTYRGSSDGTSIASLTAAIIIPTGRADARPHSIIRAASSQARRGRGPASPACSASDCDVGLEARENNPSRTRARLTRWPGSTHTLLPQIPQLHRQRL